MSFSGRGSGVILKRKILIFYHFGCWSSDRYEESLNWFYAPNANLVPDESRSQKETFVDIFLTGFLYLQSLFYFKLTRNALFMPFSSHNASQMVIFCPKFAQQIRFWWVLGKIKPRNNEKTQKMRRKAFLWGVYSGAQNRSIWRNAVSRSSEHKHLWNRPGCYKECQNGSRPPNITFFKIFWRAFLISGLYFASKQAEMHFLGHFSLKLLSGRYEANSCWNFAPTPILSFKMTQTPNKCLPEHMLTCFLHFWASIYPTPIHFLNHFLVNLVYQNAKIVILQLDKTFCLGFL